MNNVLTTTDGAALKSEQNLPPAETVDSKMQSTNAYFVSVKIGANAHQLKMKYNPATADEIKQTKLLNEILKYGFFKTHTSTR